MYSYELNKEQKEAAYDFAELLDHMKELGISIIREESTGILCMVNTKGFQLDATGKKFPVVDELSTDSIDTDKIVCAFDAIIDLKEDTSLNVVPKIQVVSKEE